MRSYFLNFNPYDCVTNHYLRNSCHHWCVYLYRFLKKEETGIALSGYATIS